MEVGKHNTRDLSRCIPILGNYPKFLRNFHEVLAFDYVTMSL